MDERSRNPGIETNLAYSLGDGDDGLDVLGVFAAREDVVLQRKIDPPGDEPERHLSASGRRCADRDRMGIVEVDELALAPFHRQTQAKGRPEIDFPLYPEGKKGEAGLGGLVMQGTPGLDDENDRIALALELLDQEEGLSLTAPPFPAGVNMEKAQSFPLFSKFP